MIFSSTIFLFGFLPLVLILYWLVPQKCKNLLLLAASLFFYGWGELYYALLMIGSICWNYLVGQALGGRCKSRKAILVTGIFGNLLLLGYFKYSNFLVENVNALLASLNLSQLEFTDVHLPIGISFFTFQAISYIIDIYRQQENKPSTFLNTGLYISMFPQLIAGPIVRYNSVAEQLVKRSVRLEDFERGVIRFIFGLAKKMLIANQLGELADAVYSLPASELSFILAWAGTIAYSLQIYFDFSGYTDMAIGLGMMFGFTFPENFNYPYTARNVRDFWRRWHMSLTSWLRDYLYIPMGGSRVKTARVTFNLLVVFLLCGLWHGASWTFIIWGFWHGIMILFERTSVGENIKKMPLLLQHCYLLLVVIVGWVFFRSESLSYGMSMLQSLFGLQGFVSSRYPIQLYLSNELYLAALAGIVLSLPVYKYLHKRLFVGLTGFVLRFSLLSVIMFGVSMKISSGTYNPFLYFRF